MKSLTRKQKAIIREIEELTDLFGLSPQKVIENASDPHTTERLELIKSQLVRSEVVISYTIIDEFLSTRIARFQFGRSVEFYKLWKTKKFKLFNYHVIEELSLMAKLRFAKAIRPIHKSIAADIERLNTLRNGLAHAFFPENLKRSKPEWKGMSIFSIDGAKRFSEDMEAIFRYFKPEIPHAVKEDRSLRK